MAGFFGMFDYSKPGKGVSKNEPEKPRIQLFFQMYVRKFWQLIQLNLLYIAFCLPIVTIGPATAGFVFVLRNLSTEQPVFLLSDFWDAVKANWKQSFVYSVLLVAVALLISFSLQFYWLNLKASSWMYLPLSFSLLMSFIVVVANFYTMLMIVTLDLPLISIIKNACIMAIVCIKSNLITLVVVGVILFASYIYPMIGFLFFVVMGFSLVGFVIAFNCYPAVLKYAVSSTDKADVKNENLFKDDLTISDKE